MELLELQVAILEQTIKRKPVQENISVHAVAIVSEQQRI